MAINILIKSEKSGNINVSRETKIKIPLTFELFTKRAGYDRI
jgi:hypothetical protein